MAFERAAHDQDPVITLDPTDEDYGLDFFELMRLPVDPAPKALDREVEEQMDREIEEWTKKMTVAIQEFDAEIQAERRSARRRS